MRILTVTHFYESHGGGIERVAGQLCRQFARLGADAAWAASDADAFSAEGVAATPLGCINPTEKLTGLPMPVPGIRGMRRLARAVRKSDAVVIHDALYATSILALIVAKLQGKRVVLIQHIAGIPFASRALRSVMRAANAIVTRPMLRAADVRVFISDTVRADLLGNPPRNASELLFNGVDHEIFHRGECAPPLPHAVTGAVANSDSPRLLFVGRYVGKKGLSVIRELARSRPELSFLLAGSGPIRPAEWRLPNVHDLGPQSAEELASLYRWADALILPSVGEGYPLVIQEAMACGLPVICGAPTDRADPGAAKWLRGVAIDLADPAGSARRCSEALDALNVSSAERSEMAQYAARAYDWRAMAERLLTLAQPPAGRS